MNILLKFYGGHGKSLCLMSQYEDVQYPKILEEGILHECEVSYTKFTHARDKEDKT